MLYIATWRKHKRSMFTAACAHACHQQYIKRKPLRKGERGRQSLREREIERYIEIESIENHESAGKRVARDVQERERER